MNYYLSAINILVNDLNLKPDEAIKRLRLPNETEKYLNETFIQIKKRELNHLNKSNLINKKTKRDKNREDI